MFVSASRALRFCALLIVAALLLAACGAPQSGAPSAASPSPESSPATAESPSPAPAESPTAAESPAGSPQTSGQIIRVTTTNAPDENNPADVARHEQLLALFKEIRPDVEVEARQGGFDKAAFTAKLAAGTMEDAYLVPFTEPQDLIANGYAADITELMQGWEHFESFNPEVLRIVQDEAGRIYGVPVGGYALGLLYSRALFEQSGLDPNRPPTTWDEVREYARQIKERTGKAGFAELSKGNQGGWHFTAWMYSFGGDFLEQQDGRWTAIFNNEAGVRALETLKAMRWEDGSMTEQQLLEVADVLPLLANGEVAMAVMAPDALQGMKTQFEANIEDFGMGPLPQAGGNATLAGGAAWMFNPKSPPEVLEAAFDWTVNRDFNLEAFEADLRGQQERGQLVGLPSLPLFRGEFQQQRDAIVARYTNVPLQNYEAYTNANLQLRPEPPVETQKLYGVLDTVMQAILTDESADPQTVLDQAVQEFQTQVLDQLPQ